MRNIWIVYNTHKTFCTDQDVWKTVGKEMVGLLILLNIRALWTSVQYTVTRRNVITQLHYSQILTLCLLSSCLCICTQTTYRSQCTWWGGVRVEWSVCVCVRERELRFTIRNCYANDQCETDKLITLFWKIFS